MPNTAPIPTAEVAQRLGKDVRTIHRWVRTGTLTALFKAPGKRGPYFFDTAEVERAEREQESA